MAAAAAASGGRAPSGGILREGSIFVVRCSLRCVRMVGEAALLSGGEMARDEL